MTSTLVPPPIKNIEVKKLTTLAELGPPKFDLGIGDDAFVGLRMRYTLDDAYAAPPALREPRDPLKAKTTKAMEKRVLPEDFLVAPPPFSSPSLIDMMRDYVSALEKTRVREATRPRPFAERLRAITAKLTYKPGHRFEVHEEPMAVRLVLVFQSTDPSTGNPFEGRSSRFYDPVLLDYMGRAEIGDREFIDRFVRPLIVSVEMHEIDEFLKVDGIHVQHPHPEQLLGALSFQAPTHIRAGGCR